MRYTHFEIRNFKGIAHLRLDFDAPPKGKVITLVGLNESGKTTILDALAYFRPGIDDPDPLILMELGRADPNNLIPIASKSNFNGILEINCGVELNDDDEDALREYLKKEHAFHCTSIPRTLIVVDRYKFADSVWDGNRGALWDFRPRGMLGRARKETVLHNSSNRLVWLDAISFLRKRMPRVWYFPNFLFDFPQRIYLEEKDPDDSIERFYRKLISEILTTVDANATVERHIVQRIQSENDAELRALEQLLILVGRQITKDVFGSWNEIFNRPQSTTKAVVKPGQDEEGHCYIEISIEDSDGLYYISERSLGFRWFFVFSLVTRYAGSDKGKPSVVFLFDEPASNLHAGAQSQLLGSLEKLAEVSTIITPRTVIILLILCGLKPPTLLGTKVLISIRTSSITQQNGLTLLSNVIALSQLNTQTRHDTFNLFWMCWSIDLHNWKWYQMLFLLRERMTIILSPI